MVSNLRTSERLSYDYLFLGFLMFLSIVGIKQASSVMTINAAKDYLSKFGYLTSDGPNTGHAGLLDINTWRNAVKDFQKFAGLNVTGQLDVQTRQLMALPRCGVRDKVVFGSDSRLKRYALQGSRWGVNPITYRISSYPKRLKHSDVKAEIARAFAVWSEHTDLTFTPKESGPVHIDISFKEGEHGDENAFDGPGAVLAHAFFPNYGGRVHFDDAEQWTIGSTYGKNLFQVAAHEFGHSLGLSHSDVETALMAPFYRGFVPNFKLDSDDVLAIQALYGKPTTRVSPRTGYAGGGGYPYTTQRPHSVPWLPRDEEICQHLKVDTVFNSADGHTYVFKGNKYYEVQHGISYVGNTHNELSKGQLISDRWPELPNHIDAAFTYTDNRTYFFKGSKVWSYYGKHLEEYYPREISEVFNGIPNNLDAAMVIKNKIYFWKGDYVGRFYRAWSTASHFHIRFFQKNLLSNIDAVQPAADGSLLFFKADKIFTLTSLDFSVGRPVVTGYLPLSDWLGCNSWNYNRRLQGRL